MNAQDRSVLLSERLMQIDAVGNRLGLVMQPQRVPRSLSDVAGIIHVGVPQNALTPWQSAAGGVGRDVISANLAAIGEGIERFAASTVAVAVKTRDEIKNQDRIDPEQFHLFTAEQRTAQDFPFANIYKKDCPYTQVYSLIDNLPVWTPKPLVTLQDDFETGIPTSSGLAAGSSMGRALLRGVQELIERDALMVTWLHGLPGKRVITTGVHAGEVALLKGEIYTFDITPAYSPFPVVAVAGGIMKEGKWRYSLGVACRESWAQAEEKAYLEWNQGVLFAGIYDSYVDVSGLNDPYKLRSFDEHAMYYTVHPEQWSKLALFKDSKTVHEKPEYRTFLTDVAALSAVRRSFKQHNISVYYKNLTTIDAKQVGVSVVKVLSPDMAMIFAHQEWPFLGGVANLLSSRYPVHKISEFPYLMPHPLG